MNPWARTPRELTAESRAHVLLRNESDFSRKALKDIRIRRGESKRSLIQRRLSRTLGSTPRKSVIVLLALIPHRQHHNLRGTDTLIQRNLPGSSEWDDQFSLHGVLRRLAEAPDPLQRSVTAERQNSSTEPLPLRIELGLQPFQHRLELSTQFGLDTDLGNNSSFHHLSVLRLSCRHNQSVHSVTLTGSLQALYAR